MKLYLIDANDVKNADGDVRYIIKGKYAIVYGNYSGRCIIRERTKKFILSSSDAQLIVEQSYERRNETLEPWFNVKLIKGDNEYNYYLISFDELVSIISVFMILEKLV